MPDRTRGKSRCPNVTVSARARARAQERKRVTETERDREAARQRGSEAARQSCLDRGVIAWQVVVFTLYGIIQRLFESPYDEQRLKAIRRRIAELRASREEQEPRNAVDMMDVVWEVGAAGE